MTFSQIKNPDVLDELDNAPEFLPSNKEKTEDFLENLDVE
jgi:hypothetical protein